MTSKEIHEHRLNMPETIENMFNVLFNDESYTWSGLATILVNRFNESDLDELNMCIKMEREKQNAR
jgi:hypothetical protein